MSPVNLPFSKAIEGFLLSFRIDHSSRTAKLYELYLNIACDWLEDPPLSKIDTESLKRFMFYLKFEYKPKRVPSSTRHGSPLSDAAQDNYWKALRSCFGWLHANDLIQSNPALNLARPRVARVVPDPFTQQEVKRLFYHAQYVKVTQKDGQSFHRHRPAARRNAALILVLLDCGIRVGELARLTFADLRLDVGELHIRSFETGKKSRERYIPLGKRTRKALWLYLCSEDLDPTHRLFGLSATSIRQLLYRIGINAQVPHTRPHRFRHTFAIEYLRNGGDVFTLQRILGHSTLDMVNHYLKLVQTDIAEAHKRASPADRWEL
ncbi:MAG: tyrosine-type recombinase/integrase [Brevefilum sp.]|jgi:integrase/recombinase XerD